MVKVEAVRIGDSPPAPLLTLIVGPSEEAKDVGHAKKEIAKRYGIRKQWWISLIKRPVSRSKLHAYITPSEYSWIGASTGLRGLNFNYVVTQSDCAAELYIDRGKGAEEENRRFFDQLFAHREAIEEVFGEALSWERLEGRRACRIRYTDESGGCRSPEEKWPALQDRIIEAMSRLECALKPYISRLKEAP